MVVLVPLFSCRTGDRHYCAPGNLIPPPYDTRTMVSGELPFRGQTGESIRNFPLQMIRTIRSPLSTYSWGTSTRLKLAGS